jgi:hypothetical protein
LWNWAELSYFPQLPATVHLNEVVCTDLTTIDGAQATYAPDTTTNGSIAGDVLPNECSMCISLRTGNRGRSARGRFYTFAVPQANMADDNFITPTYSSALATVGNDLVAAFQETTPLTIVSYRSGGVPRPGGPVYFLVSNALLVDNLVDSMRRRKPGVGT